MKPREVALEALEKAMAASETRKDSLLGTKKYMILKLTNCMLFGQS